MCRSRLVKMGNRSRHSWSTRGNQFLIGCIGSIQLYCMLVVSHPGPLSLSFWTSMSYAAGVNYVCTNIFYGCFVSWIFSSPSESARLTCVLIIWFVYYLSASHNPLKCRSDRINPLFRMTLIDNSIKLSNWHEWPLAYTGILIRDVGPPRRSAELKIIFNVILLFSSLQTLPWTSPPSRSAFVYTDIFRTSPRTNYHLRRNNSSLRSPFF